MDNHKLKAFIFALCCIIFVLVILCIILCIKVHQNAQKPPYFETIEIHDTLQIENQRILYKTKEVEVLRFDTIEIEKTDTLRDTFFVEIPISKYEYKDTIETDTSTTQIAIEFEGYKAKIDSISLIQEFHPTIEISAPKRVKFGQSVNIGLQVGYGIGITSKQFEPYVGVGVSYGFGVNW